MFFAEKLKCGVTLGNRNGELGVWGCWSRSRQQALLRIKVRYVGERRDVAEVSYSLLPANFRSALYSIELPIEYSEILVGSKRARTGGLIFDLLFADDTHKTVTLDLPEVVRMYQGQGFRIFGRKSGSETIKPDTDPSLATLNARQLIERSDAILKELEEKRKLEEQKREQERLEAEAKKKAEAQAKAAAKTAAAKPAGAPAPAAGPRERTRVGLFYGSTTGHTTEVAELIKQEFTDSLIQLINITETAPQELTQYEFLVLGVPTWHIGEMQDDWAAFLPNLTKEGYKSKKVAIFGLGDGVGYPDTYVDAMQELWEKFKPFGMQLVGYWPTEGYPFQKSKAIENGKFLGLVIDVENQNDKTEGRVKTWCAQVKREFGL